MRLDVSFAASVKLKITDDIYKKAKFLENLCALQLGYNQMSLEHVHQGLPKLILKQSTNFVFNTASIKSLFLDWHLPLKSPDSSDNYFSLTNLN